MARLMLSAGIFSCLAASTALRRRGFLSGSPPDLAAMLISLIRRVKTLPRLASSAPFLCLIVAHFEWPDIARPRVDFLSRAQKLAFRNAEERVVLQTNVNYTFCPIAETKIMPLDRSAGLRRGLLRDQWRERFRSLAKGKYYGQQRRRKQDAPERPEDAEHDGSDDRRPNGHARRFLHQHRLQHPGVGYGDHGIEH